MSRSPVVWAVIPAGGSGSRFSSQQNKLLADLNGQPVLAKTILALLSSPTIQGIMLTASTDSLTEYQALLQARFPKAPLHFTLGGSDRRTSVFNGLQALPEAVDIVVIHDAARPLVSIDVIERSIAALKDDITGVVVGIPVRDTLKQVSLCQENTIQATIDRSTLWQAQTPQVFRRADILKAHQFVPLSQSVTDDAQLMELAGMGPVVMVVGEAANLKITTREDIALAQALLQTRTSNDANTR